MLVTPLLSASPLAVPPLAQYDRKYSYEDNLDNIPKNLKALPNIRNWSEKPPDLKALNQIRHQQHQQQQHQQQQSSTGSNRSTVTTPILSISTTYNSNEHEKEYTWSTAQKNTQNADRVDRFPKATNNIVYQHNRTSINQFTRNYFFNLSATESYRLSNSGSRSSSSSSGSSTNSGSSSSSNSAYGQSSVVDDQKKYVGLLKSSAQFHSNNNNYHSNLIKNNNNHSYNASVNVNNYNNLNSTYNHNNSSQTNSTLNGTATEDINRKLSERVNGTRINLSDRSNKNGKLSTEQNIKEYNNEKDTLFYNYGYFIIIVVTLSIIGSFFLILVGLLYFRSVRGATRALALPLPLLPDDRTPLNAEPEHPVPMLSVQSPGCAGMERLGVPARSSLGSPPMRDERHMSSRRLRADTQTFQTHHQDLISRDGTILSERQLSKSADSSLHHSHHYTNHNSRNIISCPHHVALPDGEWGPDRDLQNRQFCQQSEIPRTYVKAPPNKTVRDVPGQAYLHLTSSSCNLSQRSNSDGSGVGGRGSSIGSSMVNSNNHHHHHHHHQQQQQQAYLQQQQQQQQAKNEKSKASFVAKLFFRGGGSGSSSNNSSTSSSSPHNTINGAGSSCYTHPGTTTRQPTDTNLSQQLKGGNSLSNSTPTTTPMSSTTSLTTAVASPGDALLNYTSFGGSTNSSISLTTSPLSTQSLAMATATTAMATAVQMPSPAPSPTPGGSGPLVTSASPLTSSISTSSLTNSSSVSAAPSPETNVHFI